MSKVKMGELIVKRELWVRRELSLDHIDCLTNDLVNGAKFPPLLVDNQTKTIVGGNHRFAALKKYYGQGWEEEEIECDFIDLPSYEENTLAWKLAALEDNRHLSERLGWGDRNKVAFDIAKQAGTELSDDLRGLVQDKLHFTPQTWLEFAGNYMQNLERKTPSRQQTEVLQRSKKPQDGTAEKQVTNLILPGDAKIPTPRSRLQSKAYAMIDYLSEFNQEFLTKKEIGLLIKLKEEIDRLLSAV